MAVIRSLVGVLAGYLIFRVATAAFFTLMDQNPHQIESTSMLVLSTAYAVVFALLGGYLAGLLAGRSELLHGTVVGIVIALVAIGIVMRAAGGAGWLDVFALFLMAPAAAIGGMLREQQRARRDRTTRERAEPAPD